MMGVIMMIEWTMMKIGDTSIRVMATMQEGTKMESLAIKMPTTLGRTIMGMGIEGMVVTRITVNHETTTNGTGMMGFTTTTMLTLTGFLVSWEVVVKGVTEVEIGGMIEEMLEGVREGMRDETTEGTREETIEGITEEWMSKKLTVLIVVNNLHGE
ncbi:hypothetical protein HanIR_Chr16g0799841 [Helianthus annuus]|nr:hypothetical protein HanIR_Chr16g0799841 [Helianthus annuus]